MKFFFCRLFLLQILILLTATILLLCYIARQNKTNMGTNYFIAAISLASISYILLTVVVKHSFQNTKTYWRTSSILLLVLNTVVFALLCYYYFNSHTYGKPVDQSNDRFHNIPVETIPIYYINLDRNSDRRTTFFKPHDNVFRFRAFDGKTEMEDIEAEAMQFLHPQSYQKFLKLSPGQKGCTMSHIQLISDLLQNTSHDYALICEDDIVLHNYEENMKKIIPLLPVSTDVVQLHMVNPKEILPLSKWQLYHWQENYWSTGAYLIFRKGMAKLLGKLQKEAFQNLAADYIIYRPITTYTIQPPVFVTSDAPSTIHRNHENTHKTANQKILSLQKHL